MATTGFTAPMRWPRQRLLLAVLAVSVALNLLFIAGAAWTRLHPPGSEHEWHRHVAEQLDLTPQQRAGFDRYVADMRDHSQRMRQQLTPLINGAWNEFADPHPDEAKIMQDFDSASQKWREFQRESTAQTLQFLALLSPEQRSKFVALAKERRAAHGPNHR